MCNISILFWPTLSPSGYYGIMDLYCHNKWSVLFLGIWDMQDVTSLWLREGLNFFWGGKVFPNVGGLAESQTRSKHLKKQITPKIAFLDPNFT